MAIFVIIMIALVARYVYNIYKDEEDSYELIEQYKMVSEYFVGDKDDTKPILWIHVTNNINARNWESFNSRNTTKLNQPYLYMTMKSIIDKCNLSFNICLIDDDAFRILIPKWNTNMNGLADPIKQHHRFLGLSKLLLHYGGLVVPPSFLCSKDLIVLYEQGIKETGIFVVENINKSVSSFQSTYFPDTRFMGCKKKNDKMRSYIQFQESIQDSTAQPDFIGQRNLWWCNQHILHNVTLIDGKFIGIKHLDGTRVDLADLLENKELDIDPESFGVYIPSDDVLTRSKYKWFARMSQDQIIGSQMSIAKFM